MNEYKNILVSIIMPIFNARNYIEKAIESIVAQTYRSFELIIIDDGSTDGTGDICQNYASNNENIFYYKTQNQGTCAARNRGIQYARGKYIAFSDHDDEYMPDYLKVLVTYAEANNLDMVKCGVLYEEFFSNGSTKTREESFEEEILTKYQLVNRYNSLPISFFAVWNTLYKSEIIKNHNLLFPEEVRHGQEDYFFNTLFIPYVKKVGFVSETLYKHFRRLSQSTSSKFYSDRIMHMAQYFELECQVLQPIMQPDKWKIESNILYSRKIAGVLSYVHSTQKDISVEEAAILLKEYLSEAPFTITLSLKEWVYLYRVNMKYATILMCIKRNRIRSLIRMWRIKNA